MIQRALVAVTSSGVRPASVIETLLDIDVLFATGERAEPKRHATCGYCWKRHRAVHDSVVRWYLEHDCDVDAEQARRNHDIVEREAA